MAEPTYNKPATVEEAIELATDFKESVAFLGGGTDFQIHRKQKLVEPSHLIDLSDLSSLRYISVSDSGLTIGSMVTLDDLASSSEVARFSPLVPEAAASIATPVIRMSATLGGNLLVSNRCTYYNQSEAWRLAAGSCLRDRGDTCLATNGGDKCFSRNVSDLAPALIALDAQVTITDSSGTRSIALIDLYSSDGIRFHAGLTHPAIIESITIPERPHRWYFRKLRRRQSIDFSSLTVAGVVNQTGHARICINAVSMAPLMLEFDLDSFDPADLKKQARGGCKSANNDLLPLKYRREMMDLFLADCCTALGGEMP